MSEKIVVMQKPYFMKAIESLPDVLKIFETKTPGQNWDATYKGSKVPIGVYVYMLDFTSIKGKSINSVGIVTVIE